MKVQVIKLLLIFIFLSFPGVSQQVMREIPEDALSEEEVEMFRKEFGRNKVIPEEFEKQILIALSYYPELKDIKIKFQVKKKESPLMAKPGFLSTIFCQPHERTYYVIISNETNDYLKHVELPNLPFNAQIGVIGHELSHVADFSQRGFWGIMRIAIGNLSSDWLDQFEYNTDRRTIDHGLGYQLLAWSMAVRSKLHIEKYAGAGEISEEELKQLESSGRERYMNPGTIVNILDNHPLYEDVYGQTGD